MTWPLAGAALNDSLPGRGAGKPAPKRATFKKLRALSYWLVIVALPPPFDMAQAPWPGCNCVACL